MIKRWMLIAVIGAVLLSMRPAAAFHAAEPSPLAQLLAAVPDTPNARQMIGYVDFRALVAARPGAAQPKSSQDFDPRKAADHSDTALTHFAYLGISVGNAAILQQYIHANDMLTATGIDFFTIERALEFGTPPQNGVILSGQFDPKQIGDAFSKRGFVKGDLNGLTTWCSADGCESGTKMSLTSREPADPFGGELGRKQPLVLADHYLFDAADYNVVQNMVSAYQKKTPSLADATDYRAALDALSSKEPVLQALFIDPSMLTAASPNNAAPAVQTAVKKLIGSATPIPGYSLALFAHAADQTNQYALVALVFNSQADAQTAAGLISARIDQYTSLATRRPMRDLLKDRGATLDQPTVTESGGKGVLLLTFRAPIEPSTPDANGHYTASGLLFRLFVDMVYRRDTGWLAPSTGQ